MNIQRKYYSQENELICISEFNESSNVIIRFTDPELIKLKKNSSNYETYFLNKAIQPLRETNDNLKLKYEFFEGDEYINQINILNLSSIEDYNSITTHLMKFLSKEKESIITSKIERRFYSPDNELLTIINYLDFNRVLIIFVNPENLEVKKNIPAFKNIITDKTFHTLQNEFPDLKLNYNFHEDTEIIDSLEVFNVASIDGYNLICENIMNFLSEIE
ncbi:MAG: hypothetical protein GF317_23880 [Candidatus Lokiarchaeota archaeon]|nr:hypothetical protein [Candidatus Lokiarchaeota archaeon]MBD3202413.1 hypothetical protein [Candidatus Lokiarchaeota archaeon]